VKNFGNIRTSGVLHFIIGVILADVSKDRDTFIAAVKKMWRTLVSAVMNIRVP